MRFALLALCCACAGCASPEQHTGAIIPPSAEKLETAPATLTRAQADAVRTGLKHAVQDPNTAKFGGMAAARSTKDPNVLFVCGYLGARNADGGFDGMRPYIGGLGLDQNRVSVFVVSDIAANAKEAETTKDVCRHRYGIDMAGVNETDAPPAPPAKRRK